MENPETWTDAEKVIHKALNAADQARMRGAVGLSRARQIADALREAGLLSEIITVTSTTHPEWEACRKNG